MNVHKLTPNLEVKSIEETISFYESVLGFSLIMAVPEAQDGIEQSLSEDKQYIYALVKKDTVEMMFQRTDSFQRDVEFAKGVPIGASVSFYMEMDRLDEFYNSIEGRISDLTEPKNAWYGMKEFYLKDNNGYILGFAEKLTGGKD